ncbi:hypothetical protein PHBOTO_001471 [Pseudozyma hubeiensis]|nr:hypothetical protein PHBOTO_001471 [Pseudozyma hubeiensis]
MVHLCVHRPRTRLLTEQSTLIP